MKKKLVTIAIRNVANSGTSIIGSALMRPLAGFTLFELMIGITVGLFVSLAAVSVLVNTRTLQAVTTAGSRMGENARLAMELLQKDLRSTGFVGCKPLLADAPVSLLTPGNHRFLDPSSDIAGIRGFRGNASAFIPPLNGTLLALAPSVESDFISVRVPVEPMALGLSPAMTAVSNIPQVGVNTVGNAIVINDIVLVANCKASVVFQVTEADPFSTGLLSHAVGGGFDPGNSTSDLKHVFRGDATVYRLQTRHYYIAPGTHAGTTSMWRLIFPHTGGGVSPEEVVQGVDRMQFTYGIDKGNKSVNKYVRADAVNDWNAVISVRIQLLTSTISDRTSLGTQTASYAGGAITFADRRLRSESTTVVTLRNRAP